MLDEKPAHRFAGGVEEVGAVGSVRVGIAAEAQVRLVDECSRLERMVRPLVPKARLRHGSELGVYERHEAIDGFLVRQPRHVGEMQSVRTHWKRLTIEESLPWTRQR